jgi:hypothetical protein
MRQIVKRLALGAASATLVAACGATDASESGAARAADAGAASASTTRVLGTLRATVDDTVRTWYVVSGQSQGRPYASGAWLEIAPGRRMITIGAFDTPTPPLDSFTWSAQGMPTSYGDYTGATLLVNLSVGADTKRFTLLYPPETNPAVMYSPKATLASLDTTLAIKSGAVIVTSVSVTDGLASARGTFGGTLSLPTGEGTIDLIDGSFDVSGLPDARTLRRTPE